MTGVIYLQMLERSGAAQPYVPPIALAFMYGILVVALGFGIRYILLRDR